MNFLEKKDYPKDFFYHRTSAEIYRPYLESCGNIRTIDTGNGTQYVWIKYFGNWGVSRWERTDVEPDIEVLKKNGLKHGMVSWIPYSRTDIPAGWRRLWLTDHFEETSYNELMPDYQKDWNERARRAMKKFGKSGASVVAVDGDTFIEAFRATRVKHWFKSDYISNYKTIRKFDPEKVRQWLVYHEGKAVAGLACLDYLDNHSVHFVAFTSKEAYDIQAGTALIDIWFRESLEKGIKYITFDQLRNRNGPRDQRGYTIFKENFIKNRLSFREAYFKWF